MNELDINSRETKLIQEINDYNHNIDQYRRALQVESGGLFLATLGCWSLSSNICIQAFAFIIVVMFFYISIRSNLDVKKSFNNFEKTIAELIAAEFLSGYKKDNYAEQLEQLKNKRNSNTHIVKTAPMFIFCFIFYVLSVWDQVWCKFYS